MEEITIRQDKLTQDNQSITQIDLTMDGDRLINEIYRGDHIMTTRTDRDYTDREDTVLQSEIDELSGKIREKLGKINPPEGDKMVYVDVFMTHDGNYFSTDRINKYELALDRLKEEISERLNRIFPDNIIIGLRTKEQKIEIKMPSDKIKGVSQEISSDSKNDWAE
ncbi:MAG: hypothetical protein UR27_C0003G0096 [Candidatus Peregrinibacteria bacterium GW2011_GWA2_33_10]|nr:MAG: hypothetical protein UR27_C0003G0096 [Candidatus Peregrinibacteria bacterium GW2011_GWA2_33_10]KKP40822.1 MAG: hypothetical protein UR30_C0004G0080 [Candidatus Peregrinibacteria bacterium GW2011_GWC2_33_13]